MRSAFLGLQRRLRPAAGQKWKPGFCVISCVQAAGIIAAPRALQRAPELARVRLRPIRTAVFIASVRLSLVVLPSVPPRTSRCGSILHLRFLLATPGLESRRRHTLLLPIFCCYVLLPSGLRAVGRLPHGYMPGLTGLGLTTRQPPCAGPATTFRGARSVPLRSARRLASSEAAPAVLDGSENGLHATDGPCPWPRPADVRPRRVQTRAHYRGPPVASRVLLSVSRAGGAAALRTACRPPTARSRGRGPATTSAARRRSRP